MEISAMDAATQMLATQRTWLAPGSAPATGQPLQAACQEFEAYFTSLFLSSLVKTTEVNQPDSALGMQKEWAWSQLVQVVSAAMSEGQGLGLAAALEARVGVTENKIK